MRVRGKVDGHAGDGRLEIGAVIELKAAQIILVGFAFAAMLADEKAGNRLENLAGAQDGARFDLLAVDRADRRGGNLADEIDVSPVRDDAPDRLSVCGFGLGAAYDRGSQEQREQHLLRTSAAITAERRV